MDKKRLLDAILRQFNNDELKLLCFDLGLDYENLGGDTKAIKCLELILYAERRGKLENLLVICEKVRPGVNWGELAGPLADEARTELTEAGPPSAKASDASREIHSSADLSVSDAPVEDQKKAKRSGIFVSYSHQDKKWLEKLQTMLKPLVRKGSIYVWTDTNIQTGTKWRKEIQRNLDSAKVGVMLVSPDFLASDFVCGEELPQLLKAAEEGGLKVCWVLVRSCLFETSPLADFQAAHEVSRPLNSLSEAELDGALVRICNEILRLSNSP